MINKQTLFNIINSDMGMNAAQKLGLVQKLAETPDSAIRNILQGSVGAFLASGVSKFLKLSPKAQMILTLGGFGLGMLVKKTFESEPSLVYNPKKKTYNVPN